MDISGGHRTDLILKDGVFYAWNGTTYVEFMTQAEADQLAAIGAGSDPITANIGAVPAGVTAVETGDGNHHVTTLTIAQLAALTLDDAAAIADGSLIYTFPAGTIIVNSAYISMLSDNAEHDGETGMCGLGTVIATGAIADLVGTAGFEDIMTGQAMDIGVLLPAVTIPTAGVPLALGSAASHLVHFNVAGTWADTAGTALDVDLAGVVVLDWTFMG